MLFISICLQGQEQTPSEKDSSSKLELSEATLKILEAHAAENSLESPKPQVPDEGAMSTPKKKKIQTGGLFKEWFAPFEKKSSQADQSQNSSSKGKRKPIWSWFDPTAPVSKTELEEVPLTWDGKRRIPQRFGNRERQEPEGWTLFFIRY